MDYRLKTRVLNGLLMSLLLCILFGCGAADNNDSKQTTEVESVTTGTVEMESNKESLFVSETTDITEEVSSESAYVEYNTIAYSIEDAESFHEGLAWVKLNDGTRTVSAVINTEGDIVFLCDFAQNSFGTPFENGYSYLEVGTDLYEIKSDFSVNVFSNLLEYYDEKGNGITAYGNGYIVYQEYSEGGFDSEEKFSYRIEDSEGNEVYSTDFDGKQGVISYIGRGVFAWNDYGGKAVQMFFTSTGQLQNGEEPDSCWYSNMLDPFHLLSNKANKVFITNDIFILDWCNREASEDLYFTVCNARTGKVYDVDFPKRACNPELIGIGNGFVLYKDTSEYGEDGYYEVYDLESKTFERYKGRNADRLYWENAINIGQSYGVDDDVFAIAVEGKDGNKYVSMMDKDYNEIIEPIRAESFELKDNVLLAYDSSMQIGSVELYDYEGNYLNTYYAERLEVVEHVSEGFLFYNDEFMTYSGEPIEIRQTEKTKIISYSY